MGERGLGRLSAKVALVTGASTGIGRASAEALAAAGAWVMLADVDAARGEAAARDLRARGLTAQFVRADVTVDQQVATMVRETVDVLGGLHLAFNNAGIEGDAGPTHRCTVENWSRTLAVNLTGTWNCMRHELPQILECGGGSIVNCASVAGLVGMAGAPAYVAANHGIVGLTRAAALEYATSGVRVNAVCPGVIDTEMTERLDHLDFPGAPRVKGDPTGRPGRAEEVAATVVWLCSDASSYVTGHALAVDGGFLAS